MMASAPLDIFHIVDKVGLGVIGCDGGNLPVQLPVVDHGQDGQGFHGIHTPGCKGRAADLHYIHRVIVTLQSVPQGSDGSSLT